MKRVLLIEDEPGLIVTLTDRLQSAGFAIEVATDAPSGFQRLTREPWDVVLLDVMLPGGSGFDLCRDARQRGVTAPIIMLTARGQIVDKVLGLKLGADDYLTKPFDMLELTARIEVQLRRAAASAPGRDAALPVRRDHGDFRRPRSRVGRAIELSAREFLLLKYFIEHREATLSRDELLNEVWGYHPRPRTRTVDVRRLAATEDRAQRETAAYILTSHGLGYKFVG
jgi:two-component system alkaline phosphatase synthesis response regulator PhoP